MFIQLFNVQLLNVNMLNLHATRFLDTIFKRIVKDVSYFTVELENLIVVDIHISVSALPLHQFKMFTVVPAL